MTLHVLVGTTGNHEHTYELKVTSNDGNTMRASYTEYGTTKRIKAVKKHYGWEVTGKLYGVSWITE